MALQHSGRKTPGGVARRFLLLGVLLAVAGCDSSLTGPSPAPDFSQIDLRQGTGDTAAAPGDLLTVDYTAWLYDTTKLESKGLQFDTSKGREPFSFTLGAGQVIIGWDEGLVGMKVGGLRRLVIPPSLGYGSIRQGPIPPNTSLVFEVELIEVKEPEQSGG